MMVNQMKPIDETQISRDRDTEKRLRKDAEDRLSDASELLARIASGELNGKEAATAWLQVNDPLRVPQQYWLILTVDPRGGFSTHASDTHPAELFAKYRRSGRFATAWEISKEQFDLMQAEDGEDDDGDN